MKKLLLLLLFAVGIWGRRRSSQNNRSNQSNHSRSAQLPISPPAAPPSEIDRRIAGLLSLFDQHPNEALLQSEILIEELYSQNGASTQELRVKLLHTQSQLYFRSSEVGTAIEKSRDAGAEAWLLEDDAVQKAMFLEINRSYDTFVEAAVDKVKRRVASAQSLIKHGHYRRAIQVADDAFEIARENQIAEHPWASRATATRGFAYYELGRYQKAHKEFNAAVRQLTRYWTLMEPAFKAELLRKMKNCVGYL